MEGITFFQHNNGQLQQLPWHTSNKPILTGHSTMLKLDNQMNGWKGVCVQQEHNSMELSCPVHALECCYLHIRWHTLDPKTFLSAYSVKEQYFDVTDHDISTALKMAALVLDYTSWGFPLDRIDTYSLCSGGTNALSLAGYTECQIQKVGRWKGSTFKENIWEELHVFSEGMSCNMKCHLRFVNITGGAFLTMWLQLFLLRRIQLMQLPSKKIVLLLVAGICDNLGSWLGVIMMELDLPDLAHSLWPCFLEVIYICFSLCQSTPCFCCIGPSHLVGLGSSL